MTPTTCTPLENAITRELGAHGRPVIRSTAGRWRVAPPEGQRRAIEVRLEENWLLLEAPIDASRPRSAWSLLGAAADLPPMTRIVQAGASESPYVRAELPIDEPGGAGRRVGAACAGLDAGLERLHGRRRESRKADRAGAAVATGPTTDPRELLRANGRTFTERDDGTLMVDLEVERAPHRAGIVADGARGVRIAAPLGRIGRLRRDQREAIGDYLLAASAHLRLAGAAMNRSGPAGEETLIFLRVDLPSDPTIEEIEHALAALAAGCELIGPETDALIKEGLAASYLLIRGVAPHRRTTVDAARAS